MREAWMVVALVVSNYYKLCARATMETWFSTWRSLVVVLFVIMIFLELLCETTCFVWLRQTTKGSVWCCETLLLCKVWVRCEYYRCIFLFIVFWYSISSPLRCYCDCDDHIFIREHMLMQILVKMNNCEEMCRGLVERVLLGDIVECCNKFSFYVFINNGFYLWKL